MEQQATTRSYIQSEVDQIKTRSNFDLMTDDERIALLSRCMRSSLRSRKVTSPGALYNEDTNCVGAILQLQQLVRTSGINTEIQPVLVSRLPWQSEDADYSIHVAGIIKTSQENGMCYIDPTPSAGYLYGQTAKLHDGRIYDSAIDGYTDIHPLTPLEFRAIVRSYEYEGGEVSDDDADAILEDLRTVPAYRARLAFKLFQKTGKKYYRSIISDTPPESLRGVHRSLLEGEALKRQEAFSTHNRLVRKKIGEYVAHLATADKSEVNRAHWRATLGELTGSNITAALMHPLDTNHTDTPILQYEARAMRQKDTAMTSNSYFFKPEGIQ
jgi:hypothetical protein